jgi:hypothetical protein
MDEDSRVKRASPYNPALSIFLMRILRYRYVNYLKISGAACRKPDSKLREDNAVMSGVDS